MAARRITGFLAAFSLLCVLVASAAPARAQPVGPFTPAAGAGMQPAPSAPASNTPLAAPVAGLPGTPPAAESAPLTAAEPAVSPEGQLATESAATDAVSTSSGGRIVYVLERIDILGNRTRAAVIRRFVTLQPGDPLDVDDPAIEQLRFRLMGTGWFDEVHLRLQKGSERGRVVLVIEVVERNTLVISRVIAGLARVVTSSTNRDDALRPYAGLGLTESNLFGSGIGVGVAGVVSQSQFGLELQYRDPMRLGAGFDLGGRAFYNHARDFFGRSPSVVISCPYPMPNDPDAMPCDPDVDAKRAVVIYNRAGFGFGTGHDITSALRYEIDWLGEIVNVQAKPSAAYTLYGAQDQEQPAIDFRIDDGISYVSSLHLGLIFDRRDDPALPSKGQLLRLDARIASGLFGSTYDFARLEANFRHFQPLPWHHVISFGLFVGSVFGPRAPFFYRFYAADLSDLLPSRALDLNLDFRRTHNLLGTSIREFDKEDLAARVDFEYELPLHRGGGDIRGIDAYAGAGLFMLADRMALRTGLPGYHGLSRIPVDLTFDLGIQADTVLGVFKVGFSSLIGFLPDLGQASP